MDMVIEGVGSKSVLFVASLSYKLLIPFIDFETFAKRSILFKAKKGENFNHRNTLSILRIEI